VRTGTEGNGVIFAATGPEKYTQLAIRAARSLRRHNPELQIDLFTDNQCELSDFDRVHVLTDPWARSRIDAMRLSRFDRTLMLDSDVIVLADIGDIFQVLDRFDIALAHDQERNSENAQNAWKTVLPAAFPQFNGGVIAVRRSDAVQAMLGDWASAVRDHATGRDQQVLREILWHSALRVATLPAEFNVLDIDLLKDWSVKKTAPRIVHQPMFHEQFQRFAVDDPVAKRIGLWHASGLPGMLRADRDLARRAGRPVGELDGVFKRLKWVLGRLFR
jgi:hypothetical protein